MMTLSIHLLTYCKIIIAMASMFVALGVACAMWIGLRRQHPPQPDPLDPPLGEVMGFSQEQLEHFAKRSRLSMRRDPCNRSLDFSFPPETPQRTATGGRSMPFGAFARRTPLDEVPQ